MFGLGSRLINDLEGRIAELEKEREQLRSERDRLIERLESLEIKIRPTKRRKFLIKASR